MIGTKGLLLLTRIVCEQYIKTDRNLPKGKRRSNFLFQSKHPRSLGADGITVDIQRLVLTLLTKYWIPISI